MGTCKEQSITITSGTNMSKEDIDKAVKEAEQYAAEDKKRREEADLRNNADQLVYTAEKTVNDLGDKLTEEEKTDIKGAADALKEALKGTDVEAIKVKQEDLQKKVYAVSEKVYKAAQEAQAAAGQQGAPNTNGDPNNVYDADYTDVDDTKK